MVKRNTNHSITAKSVKKSVNAICSTKGKPYPVETIKNKVTEYYQKYVNEISESVIIDRLIAIESRTNYAPNVMFSLIWGLIASLLWMLISEDRGLTILVSAYGQEVVKMGFRNGIQSIAMITIMTFAFLVGIVLLLIIVSVITIMAYHNGEKIWCDKYKLFISDHEKRILQRMLMDKSSCQRNVATYVVRPKKIHVNPKRKKKHITNTTVAP